jgi:xylan 1,4-beta-xylosidase
MNLGTQLRDISRGFEIISSYPEFKHLPVIIGESDPEGCAACSVKDYPENAYRNGTLYSSYTAAAFAREFQLADAFGVHFEGAVTWAFEFEDQPWFNGYRSLATNGIDKPVLNVFRMFAMMRGKRARVSGDIAYDLVTIRDSSVRGERPDINALAAIDSAAATIMIWNYHDVNSTGENNRVLLQITGIPVKRATLYHYRIDRDHSNAYTAWLNIGSPQNLTADQYRELEETAKLELYEKPKTVRIRAGKTETSIILPRQGVSLLKYVW